MLSWGKTFSFVTNAGKILRIKATLLTRSRSHNILRRFVSSNNRFIASDMGKSNANTKQKKRGKKLKVAELTENTAVDELTILNEELKSHDNLYYNLNSPSISDSAYDALVRRAEDIVGRFVHLRDKVERFGRIGSKTSNEPLFPPFDHSGRMLSLENAIKEVELFKFIDRAVTFCSKNMSQSESESLSFVVEPKIDGLSLAVRYINGQLFSAGTRGDGSIGEDVTENARSIANLPSRIDTPYRYVEVRGEVYLSNADFAILNQERLAANESKFANPRNAAAGSLRQSDSSVAAKRGLRFFAYSISSSQTPFFPSAVHQLPQPQTKDYDKELELLPEKQADVLAYLKLLNFSVSEPWWVVGKEGVLSKCLELGSRRPQLDFGIDGAVVKVNSFSVHRALGDGARSPKGAIAFKFNADEADTRLLDIVVQVGRTGSLTPVAVLRPVRLGGVTIERATLHNEAEVNRLGLGGFKPTHRPEDADREEELGWVVRISRAGEVIPKITGLVKSPMASSSSYVREAEACNSSLPSDYSLPSHCPVCGSKTEKDGAAGVLVRCTGGPHVCTAQAVEGLVHFCSRDAADITGLGPATLEELYSAGLVRSTADLFRLRGVLDKTSSVTAGDIVVMASTDVNLMAKEKGRQQSDALADSGLDAGLTAASSNHSGSLRTKKGWGDRSVNNILAAIDTAREGGIAFHRFLYGLGVRHVGLETAKDIAAKFNDFGLFWRYLKKQADIVKEISVAAEKAEETEAKGEDIMSKALEHTSKAKIRKANTRKTEQSTAPKKKKSKNVTEVNVDISPPLLCEKLMEISGLGPKAAEALVNLAMLPQSSSSIDDLLHEVKVRSYDGSDSTVESTSFAPMQKDPSPLVPETTSSPPFTAPIVEVSAAVEVAGAGESTEQKEAPRLRPSTPPLSGRRIVFTGKLSEITRSEAQNICVALGGSCDSAVTRDTNLLVVAAGGSDSSSTAQSSKERKARKLGIEIWDENYFMDFQRKHHNKNN